MNYTKKTGVVSKAEQGAAAVYITYPQEQHGTGTCAGCGLCASRPNGRTYSVPVSQERELKTGDVVIVEIAEFPFAASISMIFIFPIILMVLFPAVSTAIGKAVDIPLLYKGWFVICAGISGFTAAFILNFCIDRRFRRKYPPQIGHEEGADA